MQGKGVGIQARECMYIYRRLMQVRKVCLYIGGESFVHIGGVWVYILMQCEV